MWSPDEAVARAFTPGVGPPHLTLYTMKNTRSDNGAHSGLLINANQRVMFDPAGSFSVNVVPERNDVLFGITEEIEAFYVSYHARETYYVVGQKVKVDPDVAELAVRLALANGPVPQAACTRATSNILRQLPGFEFIRTTYFPNNLSDAFATIPGVETRTYRENDSDDKSIAAAQINAALTTDR